MTHVHYFMFVHLQFEDDNYANFIDRVEGAVLIKQEKVTLNKLLYNSVFYVPVICFSFVVLFNATILTIVSIHKYSDDTSSISYVHDNQ